MKKSLKSYTKRNSTWHKNHLKIIDAMVQVDGKVKYRNEFITTDLQLPNAKQIAEFTGLTETTVYRHLSEIGETECYKQHINKYYILAESLLMYMYNLGRHVPAGARTFMYILEKLNSRVNRCNNFIQINNLIISQDQLQQLPEQQLKEAEKLISDLLNE